MFLVYMPFVGDFKALLIVCPMETGVIFEVVTLDIMIYIKYKLGVVAFMFKLSIRRQNQMNLCGFKPSHIDY